MNADQQRLAERLLKEGKSVREVARTFSVHPATLYRTAVAAQPANGLRDHPPCGQTREALGALRPLANVSADVPPRSPRPSPREQVPGIRLIRRDPPPSGRPARLHRFGRRWGGLGTRSGAMTRQRPEPMSTTEAEAISVPTLDPARAPAPLVSCRQPCPQATREAGGGRTDDTDRP
jgi:transposase-like protein